MQLTRLLSPILGFGDSSIALIVHPYALARTALRQELEAALETTSITGRVLDVGCGSMPYRRVFANVIDYHGLEIDQPRNRSNPYVTHWYDGHAFPQKDQDYAAVLCSQVLEHSFNPEQLLTEIYRVLQPGGRLLLTIPFFWPEHEQPYDSQRFTSFGIVQRLKEIGFENISIRKTNPGLACLIQLTIEWLESLGRRLPSRLAMPWHLIMALPYSLMNLIGFIYRNLPSVRCGNSKAELYLDLVVTANKP